MPRKYSRITVPVTGIRVERLQDIRYLDVMKEGAPILLYPHHNSGQTGPLFRWYQELWDSLNAKRGHGWDHNDWVWLYEFERKTDTHIQTGQKKPALFSPNGCKR